MTLRSLPSPTQYLVSIPCLLAFWAATGSGAAQSTARPVVVLDPAYGGAANGARFPDGSYEKKVTLDLANRLRFLLNARGFDVVFTRDNDVSVSNDERAAVANTAHPFACLLLHATPGGRGVHLYTSALRPTGAASTAVLWNEAQAPFVLRSLRLSSELTAALTRSSIPVSSGVTWMHPLDNMQCAAVAVEIGPSKRGAAVTNSDYAAAVAGSLAGALLSWQAHGQGTAESGGQP